MCVVLIPRKIQESSPVHLGDEVVTGLRSGAEGVRPVRGYPVDESGTRDRGVIVKVCRCCRYPRPVTDAPNR